MDVIGMLLGAALTFALIAGWKALGRAKEALGRYDWIVANVKRSREDLAEVAQQMRELQATVAKLEATSTETQLRVMDAAEKVAHRLRDRQRKRADDAGSDGDDSPVMDPNLMLAEARRAFPLPTHPGAAHDTAQLQLLDREAQ